MNNILRNVVLKKKFLSDKLFDLVDDYSIYAHFIGYDIEIAQAIPSPIRGVDDHPSFCLYIPTRLILNREEIWFKDLADGRYGNVFKFVENWAFHHYGKSFESNYEIIKFIDSEMSLGLFDKNGKQYEKIIGNYVRKQSSPICFKSRPLTDNDLKYWKQYEINEETLNYFNVKSVKYLLTENGLIIKEFRKKDLAFIYIINDKVKLYRPNENKAFKFRNNCPGNDPFYYQGFDQLEGHNTLIITKSMKDVMVFKVMFDLLGTSVDCLAPHAESINLSDKFVLAIKERYKRIIVVSDFDLAGVKFAQKCRKEHELLEYKFISTKRYFIDGKYKVLDKDISDYLMLHKKDKTLKFLKTWNVK
jgi:hypothetical protein